MSGGGGKGGSKTQETTIPAWIRDPAIRNLQRAEDVQRIEYMPYYGADVAAFNPMQNAAMNNNIATAQAFGLLDPNSTLTATTGMPTPTDFDGFSGYSSQPMYESALAELKAKQPDAVAQYDALFGAPAMAQLNASRNSSRGGNSGASPSRPQTPSNFTPNYDTSTWSQKQQDSHNAQINPNSTVNTLDASYGGVTPTGTDYKSIVAGMNAQNDYEKAAGIGKFTPTPFSGNPHMGK
jgi:hypothetical protein